MNVLRKTGFFILIFVSFVFFVATKHSIAAAPDCIPTTVTHDSGTIKLCGAMGDLEPDPNDTKKLRFKYVIKVQDISDANRSKISDLRLWYSEGSNIWARTMPCHRGYSNDVDTSSVNPSNVVELAYECDVSSMSSYGTRKVTLAYCWDSPLILCNTFAAQRWHSLDDKDIDFTIYGNDAGGTLSLQKCSFLNFSNYNLELNLDGWVADNKYFIYLYEGSSIVSKPYSCSVTNVGTRWDWLLNRNMTSDGAVFGPRGWSGYFATVNCGISSLDPNKEYKVALFNSKTNRIEDSCMFEKVTAKFTEYKYVAVGDQKLATMKIHVQVPSGVSGGRYSVKVYAEDGTTQVGDTCTSFGNIDRVGDQEFECSFLGVPGGTASAPLGWRLKLFSPSGALLSTTEDLEANLSVYKTDPDELSTDGTCACYATGICTNSAYPPGGTVQRGTNNCFNRATQPTLTCIPGSVNCKCTCADSDLDIEDSIASAISGLPAPIFDLSDFAGWMANIHNYLIALGVIISVFMLPYAFVLMGTGDPSNIKKGQEMLQSLAIGLAVLILSGTIIRIIASEVIGL